MAEDTPKDRGNLFENFSQDLDLENEEWLQWDVRPKWSPV